jgi:hypothetical protein
MKLIFVYNADSGMLNSILESVHKMVSPKTYNCNLCAITFGAFSEDDLWKSFRENSSLAMDFYHQDEFLSNYKNKKISNDKLPVIFSENNGEIKIFISSEKLNTFKTSEELIEEIMSLTS